MDKREENPVISELENSKSDFRRVIDIGCGDGKMLFQIVEKFGVNGVGIDSSSSRISSARSEASLKV